MTSKPKHRGKHPKDAGLFNEKTLPALKAALADYVWLLSRAYTENASLKLVGDRFSLTQRQRMAVHRCACSEKQREKRARTCLEPEDWKDKVLWIDGFNLLITVEGALSGACLFKGWDGCLRDIAGIHGSYRKVMETLPALELIGEALEEADVKKVKWWWDGPVSNSGRMKTLVLELAREKGWEWEAEVVKNPDLELVETDALVVSSDSWILDHAQNWANLAVWVIENQVPEAEIWDLRPVSRTEVGTKG